VEYHSLQGESRIPRVAVAVAPITYKSAVGYIFSAYRWGCV